MHDFSERTDLGDGCTWTAKYESWDWAHHGRFYFTISIRRGDEVVERLKVWVCDRAYGDVSCRLTDAELSEELRAELHSMAAARESNTGFV